MQIHVSEIKLKSHRLLSKDKFSSVYCNVATDMGFLNAEKRVIP